MRFTFKEREFEYNKEEKSQLDNIFQMMFFQKYHFADSSQLPVGFSSGFSNGFATAQALQNTNPIHRYAEGFFNKIEADYNIIGINFPLQPICLNVFWLDENNLFQAVTLSGNKVKTAEITNFFNENSVLFSERKAGSINRKKLKANTGWMLTDEVPLIENLLESSRAWLIDNDFSRIIEAVPITNKLEVEDESRDLNQFTLEFETNE